MTRAKQRIVGLAAVVLIPGWGCSGGGATPSVSSATEEATVTGVVTVNGQPPAHGEITFDPTNINRPTASPRSVKVDTDGKYSVKTLVGENSVTVHGPTIDKDPGLSTNSRIVDVKPGTNSVPIELP
jgi:hypothetical protein